MEILGKLADRVSPQTGLLVGSQVGCLGFCISRWVISGFIQAHLLPRSASEDLVHYSVWTSLEFVFISAGPDCGSTEIGCQLGL